MCVGCGSVPIMGAMIFVFAHPLATLALCFFGVWILTFFFIVKTSSNKWRVKWWLFMPFASAVSSAWSSIKAGAIMWVPALLIYDFKIPQGTSFEAKDVIYVVCSAGLASILSAKWISNFDQVLHAD